MKRQVQLSRDMTKPTKWECAQRRLRSALASAQSDLSSLSAKWVVKGPRFLHADSKDSDQTGRMPRLIWGFASLRWAHTHFVGFVMSRLSFCCDAKSVWVNGVTDIPKTDNFAVYKLHSNWVFYNNTSNCISGPDYPNTCHSWRTMISRMEICAFLNACFSSKIIISVLQYISRPSNIDAM